MISTLLRRLRRFVRPPTRSVRHGLFFGPFPARMPAEWGGVAAHPSYRAAHERLATLVESARGWRPEIGVVDPPSPRITPFEYCFCSETVHQLAQLAVVRAEGIPYDFVAAVSLGEFAAAAASGAMSADDAVSIMMAALDGILAASEGDLVLLPLGALGDGDATERAPLLVMRGLRSEVRAVRHEEMPAMLSRVPGARALGLRVMPHTRAVDVTALQAAQSVLAPRAPAVPLYTASAGGRVEGRVDIAYWTHMVREVSRLDELLRSLPRLGSMDLIGIGSVALSSELATSGVQPGRPVPSLSAYLATRPSTAAAPPPRLDPRDVEIRRDSNRAYERCRHAQLVESGHGELLVIGHAAVQEVLRRADDFSSSPNATFPILHGADGPDHARIRRALTAYFTPARQREREAPARMHTAATASALRQRDSFNVVADFARPIASRVACEWLGIEEASAPRLLAFAPTSVRWADVQPLLTESGMLHELRTAGELHDDEIAQLAPFLLTAGLTTVTDFVVNAMCALHERPAVLAGVRADDSLLGSIVDELLRLEPPVHALPRLAVRDTEVRGHPIAAGTTVHCGFAAANRDPDAYQLPNALLPERHGPRSLTFGLGPHYCLGAATGRTFAEILLGALLFDLAEFEPAEDLRALSERANPGFGIRRRVEEIELRRAVPR